MRIGLREANQKFSKAIKAVKEGEEVVLTDRGTPIALIKPYRHTENVTGSMRRLETVGLLRAAARSKPLPHWTPRPIKGAPPSQTIREERHNGR